MFAHETGSGTPVVLLHGFGVDHRILLPLEPAFERSGGWRRLYLDLPGATQTPAGDIQSTQQLADAVLAEITTRLGDEPFAIVGNSFGGMIARHVAHELRHQVLGLATIAGVFVAEHGERDVPPRQILVEDAGLDSILADAAEEYRQLAVIDSTHNVRAFLTEVLPGVVGADQPALDRIAEHYALDQQPEDRHPEPFAQPTLHLTARQDDVVGYHDAWRRIEHYPRASFAVLDGAGHNILIEQQELCDALVSEWLKRMRHLST